ncbi:RNA polymerase sigma factor [Aquimarina litoralis]|uniref:RNA polymerase sigma factor n=1 Tax=Aquimarina litoralis TaxID=584605 RepID=UPI001C57E597|nr:sigma-70 family RNA polymerase sigma factor [Aquimarina litoralis]MBW1296408.1 sigma-70 family RNA polymerase sigma factor [Aquimarina litoralis]
MGFKNDLIYIDKVKKGDLTAFSYLVEKHKDMVYALALKIIGNTIDAEDVAQESFIKAYQNIGEFKFESKFSTWLYTITYRSALYHKRKNKIDTRSIETNDEKNFQTNSSSQIEDLKIGEQQKFIKIAIDSLPAVEGLLVTLFYIDENTVEEISSITGLSVTNVKVKLFRARKKIRKKLNILLNGDTSSIL